MNQSNTNVARNERPPRQTWHQMADEAAAMELLEAHDRIRDLAGERDTYRMLSAAALESIARLTKRNKQLAGRIDHLNAQLREMFNAPCLACRRANRSERAA